MNEYKLLFIGLVTFVGAYLLHRRSKRAPQAVKGDAVVVRPPAQLRFLSIAVPLVAPVILIYSWVSNEPLEPGVVAVFLTMWVIFGPFAWAFGFKRRITFRPGGVEYVLGPWTWHYSWNDIARIEGFPTGREPLRFRFTAQSGKKFDAESTMEGWLELLDQLPRLLPERLKATLSAHGS